MICIFMNTIFHTLFKNIQKGVKISQHEFRQKKREVYVFCNDDDFFKMIPEIRADIGLGRRCRVGS